MMMNYLMRKRNMTDILTKNTERKSLKAYSNIEYFMLIALKRLKKYFNYTI
jgi:hypothetical protein